jgi:hypothetical protein
MAPPSLLYQPFLILIFFYENIHIMSLEIGDKKHKNNNKMRNNDYNNLPI